MRKIMWVCVGTLLLGGFSAQASAAGDGFQPPEINRAWDGLQARLTLGTANSFRADLSSHDSTGQRVNSLSLMGDYYLSRPLGLGTSGGLRATSGLMLGPRSALWGMPSAGGLFSMEHRNASAPGFDSALDSGTTPYLGVGYTGLSPKGGWGVSADLGLMALSPGSVRLGRVFNGSQTLDEAVRDFRLSPVLQLGVSYSF